MNFAKVLVKVALWFNIIFGAGYTDPMAAGMFHGLDRWRWRLFSLIRLRCLGRRIPLPLQILSQLCNGRRTTWAPCLLRVPVAHSYLWMGLWWAISFISYST
jgi:hypothetical protein